MNYKHREAQQPTTDEQALKKLENYIGIYHFLAIAQYRLSRQSGKSIEDSLRATYTKVSDVCTTVIERCESTRQ